MQPSQKRLGILGRVSEGATPPLRTARRGGRRRHIKSVPAAPCPLRQPKSVQHSVFALVPLDRLAPYLASACRGRLSARLAQPVCGARSVRLPGCPLAANPPTGERGIRRFIASDRIDRAESCRALIREIERSGTFCLMRATKKVRAMMEDCEVAPFDEMSDAPGSFGGAGRGVQEVGQDRAPGGARGTATTRSRGFPRRTARSLRADSMVFARGQS